MIEQMTKYSFVLLSGGADAFLERLQGLGVVDITRSKKPVDSKSETLLARSEALQKACGKLEALDFSKDPDWEEVERLSRQEAPEGDPVELYTELSARLDTVRKEVEESHKQVEVLRPWGEFDADALKGIEANGFKIRYYCVSKKKFDSSWASQYPLQEIFDNGSKVWFVTVSDDENYSFPAEETAAPEHDFSSEQKRLESLQKEMTSVKASLLQLKERLPEMKEEKNLKASELDLYLAGAGAGTAAEGLVTTFTGFAPTEGDERLCSELDKMDGIVYIKEDAVKEDNPPIKFKENRFVKMFTVLTDMYGRPVYDEFDPTPYISFFFTLFFAMCMGDAGYGIILAILGIGMRNAKGMSSMAPLVTTLGVATFVMGIILHTFFGMDISTAAWVPGFLKKCMITGTIAGYDAQMLLSIAIGVVHLCIAMTLKAAYSVKRKGFTNSLGTLGWTLLIVGGVIVGAVALLGVLDSAVTKWVVIVLGIVSAVGIFLLNDIHRNPLLNIGSGLYETYNTVTGLLGDVLSYLRLYALGLAGGMLGSAFNSLGMTVFGIDVPVVNILGCALILVFGHVLNLAMCVLGAFVHPLRLNFLEFFKNSGYEGAGRVYSPLAAADNNE